MRLPSRNCVPASPTSACDERVAEYHAPEFPGKPLFVQWDFADPLAEGMTLEERTRSFEKVFWQIVRRVTLFMELPRYTSPVVLSAPSAEPVAHERDIVCPG
jgi:arsenate reductase